jgi:sulfite reductase (NADPH) flavoprotein alpha-component
MAREVAPEPETSTTVKTVKPQGKPESGQKRPFPASLLSNLNLNGPGSGRETRHFEIALDGSDLAYQVGDALGIMPTNCPDLVEELIRALGLGGEEIVPGANGAEISLREALLRHYEITRVPKLFLQFVAARSRDPRLERLTAPAANGEQARFLQGGEIIDLLLAFPDVQFSALEFVGLLRKLRPRLYSISSSPKVHPGQVHLTVSVVRYESRGRQRKGVCSTFLADRAGHDTPVPVFVQTNKSFRPPADGRQPIIMIGPGTGIAPFRAFLQERRATGARGQNWLFFGDRHEQTDFLYRDELTSMLHDGSLTRLDTAFSRDQPEKIYVQHRMLEQAKELFNWLEDGASFYVCGDASHMARDVDAALHRVVEIAGGRSPDCAAEYVEKLKADRRYLRDVY